MRKSNLIERFIKKNTFKSPGPTELAQGRIYIVQSVMCLAADTCLTADPGVTLSIPARSHTFLEIDHEIISTVILLPSADSRSVVVSYKQNYVHEVLDNCLVKLAQEKRIVR